MTQGTASMADRRDDDTTPTEEDGLLDQLRRDGILGPFVVADWAGDSDVGSVRSENEDRWATVADTLFAIADGMGGHRGGALAAATAIDVVRHHGAGMTEASAAGLAARANSAVLHAGEQADVDQLGTTLVTLAAHRNHAVVLSVGDSRAYRFRGGELEQLTRDHTVRNELIASGVPLEVAERSKIRLDALTSHIGRSSDLPIAAHVASYSVMAGDRFLLCTDGVHGQLDQETMERSLTLAPCTAAVDDLLARARHAGGRDNATAVVVEFARAEMGDA